MAGDPHTFISLAGDLAFRAGFQVFPLQFRWLDDGPFVTAAINGSITWHSSYLKTPDRWSRESPTTRLP